MLKALLQDIILSLRTLLMAELFEIAGTSRMEVENAKLQAELVFAPQVHGPRQVIK